MTIDAARPTPVKAAYSDWAVGIGLLVVGTIAFSSAGFFVRLIERDAPTILFWRGIFTAIAVVGYVWWQEGRGTWASFRDMGWSGWWVAALSTASIVCFIASLQYTTVANNSIIFGTAPFIIAALAWVWIRERPSAPTLWFAVIAMLGATLVVGSSFRLSGDQVLGDFLAVLMTLAFAVKTVLVRQQRHRSMVPAGCMGALLGTIGAAPFATWRIEWFEMGLFALFGFSQQGAGLILTTLGIGRVPAAQSALIMSLDVPLAPVWVWMAFGEKPAFLALIGGSVVLFAIIGHIVVEGRRRPFS